MYFISTSILYIHELMRNFVSLQCNLYIIYLQITGNTDRYSRATQFFTYPVIAREIALKPVSFNQKVSLRVNLYGQPLANFNRTVMRYHIYKQLDI